MCGSNANSRPSSNTLTTVFERRMIRAAYAAVRAVVANGWTAYAHSVHRGPERPVVLIVVDFTRIEVREGTTAVTPSRCPGFDASQKGAFLGDSSTGMMTFQFP